MASISSITFPSGVALLDVQIEVTHESNNKSTKGDTRTQKLVGDTDYTKTRQVVNVKSTTIYTRGDPDQPSPSQQSSAQQVRAALISGGNAFLNFQVDSIAADYNGKSAQLGIFAAQDGLFAKDVQVALTDAAPVNNGSATFTLSTWSTGPQSPGLPAGLWGNFYFKVSVDSVGWINSDPTPVELEAYALYTPPPPGPFARGLPLTLLRMFLLPVIKSDLREQKDYVQLITRIVHGSAKPFTGAPSNTIEHWLKYECYSGTPSFSSQWGLVGLNLGAWLDAWRIYDQYNMVTTVNCYDQAAAAEVALVLGIPHQQVHWQFHQVYGYIKTGTLLVGWGDCNNPFFKGDVTKMRVDDSARDYFTNHAYLSWSTTPVQEEQYKGYDKEMNDMIAAWRTNPVDHLTMQQQYADKADAFFSKQQLTMMMIDACAGPHVGDENRAAYDSHKDIVTKPYSDYTEHHMGAGLSVPPKDKPKGGSFLLDQVYSDTYNTAIETLSGILTTSTPATVVFTTQQLDQLQQNASSYVANAVNSTGQKPVASLIPCPIRPYTDGGGTDVEEIKYANTGTNSTPEYFSIILRRSIDNATALKQLSKQLGMYTLTTAEPGQDRTAEFGVQPTVKVAGWNTLVAFVYGNIQVEVSGTPAYMRDIGWLISPLVKALTSPDLGF